MQLEILYDNQSWAFRRTLDQLNLKIILEVANERLKELPESFGLRYLDEDQDLIDITCEEDFNTFRENVKSKGIIFIYQSNLGGSFKRDEYKRQCRWADPKFRDQERAQRKEFLKQCVREMLPEISSMVAEQLRQVPEPSSTSQEVKQQEKPVHNGITCDGCECHPILGVRYKCSICEDFDFCEKCEAVKEHEHPFLKIKLPSQTPSFICSAVGGQKDLPIGRCVRKFMPHVQQIIQQVSQNPETKVKCEEMLKTFVSQVLEPIRQQHCKQQEVVQTEQKLEQSEVSQQTKLTDEQQMKLIQLSELFQVKPERLVDLVKDCNENSVEEIAWECMNNPGFVEKITAWKIQDMQ